MKCLAYLFVVNDDDDDDDDYDLKDRVLGHRFK